MHFKIFEITDNFTMCINLKDHLFYAIDAAIEAGKAIMDIYNNENFEIEAKSDKSPLTLADKRANKIIVKKLSHTNLPVISEESEIYPFSIREKWNRCWIVDPLDGTKEFIKKNGEFTVNIALIENGDPVLGVIYVPARRMLYFGIVEDKKSFKAEVKEELNYKNFCAMADELVPCFQQKTIRIAGSRSHMSEDTLKYIEKVKLKFKKKVEIIATGSSLKFCLVAEGSADVYPRFSPTMEWDTAAGQAICEAVGLQVMDTKTGKKMKYNRENLINNNFLVSGFGKS